MTQTTLKEIGEGDYCLVALHKFENSLCAYDVATNRELFRLPTQVFPHEICLSPDRRLLYVTEYGLRGVESEGRGGNTVAVFDWRSRERTSTIGTGRHDRPHGVATHAAGNLFVTSESTQSLLIFDLASERLLHAVNNEQKLPHITGVSPDGKTVYAANIGSNSLTAIEVESGTILKQIPVLERPEGMAFSPDGKLLYVVNRESRAIAIVDTAEQQMTGQIATGNGPVRIVITPDGERIAFPLFHDDAVQIADTRMQQVTQTIAVGRQPAAFIGIALPAMLSVEFLPRGATANQWVLAGMTADGVAGRVGGSFGAFCWYMILLCGFLVLLPNAASNADGFIRRWVDVCWTALRPLRKLEPGDIGKLYFGLLIVYLAIGVFFLSIAKPLWLIVAYGNLGNLALGFSCWHTLRVNTTLLPPALRPRWAARVGLVLAGAYFFALAILTGLIALKWM